MSDRDVVLVCPKLPPTRDGVGDYTYHLASELAKSHTVTVATTAGQDVVTGRFRVVPVSDWTLRGMAPLWPELEAIRPSFINVQWVPFLWGRWGLNFALPLTAWRLRRAGFRVVMTVHEPYMSFDTWRRVPMAVVQRLGLAVLMAASAKISVTFSFLRDLFARRFPWRRDDIFWLPVGSNIPRVPLTDQARDDVRSGLGFRRDDLVVVMFHPHGAGKMFDLALDAWKAIHDGRSDARLLLIGCSRDRVPADILAAGDVVCTGYVEPSRVSHLLSIADLCLAPYIDGVSARRGSVMAAMQHGVPVITTNGRLTDREVFERSPLALIDVTDPAMFVSEAVRLAADSAARQQLQEPTAAFYERHFSWPLIARSLLERCQ